MALKSEIRKAITNNSKYIAKKVYKPEYSENFAGQGWITIEIEVRKKTHKKSVTN
jgi:hypothetical protein